MYFPGFVGDFKMQGQLDQFWYMQSGRADPKLAAFTPLPCISKHSEIDEA